jgi:hypothetical protein
MGSLLFGIVCFLAGVAVAVVGMVYLQNRKGLNIKK